MLDPREMRTSEPRGSKLERRLAAYALAAGAGMLAVSGTAKADIVFTPANASIGPGAGMLFVDLANDGNHDFLLNLFESVHNSGFTVSYKLHVSPAGSGANRGLAVVPGSFSQAAALKRGARIGPAVKFEPGSRGMATVQRLHTGSPGYFGVWLDVQHRYLGLKFEINGQVHYGWAELTVQKNGLEGFVATLEGYAYETVANRGLLAGQKTGMVSDATRLEQPATLGMLALGSLGLDLWRRRESLA